MSRNEPALLASVAASAVGPEANSVADFLQRRAQQLQDRAQILLEQGRPDEANAAIRCAFDLLAQAKKLRSRKNRYYADFRQHPER